MFFGITDISAMSTVKIKIFFILYDWLTIGYVIYLKFFRLKKNLKNTFPRSVCNRSASREKDNHLLRFTISLIYDSIKT